MEVVNTRRAVGEVLAELVRRVRGLRGDDGEDLFGRVEVFDCERLVEASEWLLLTEQRVCLVVPLDEEFHAEMDGMKLLVKRRLPVGLLVSDRVLGNRAVALEGSDTEYGAYELAERVLPVVTGLLLGPDAHAGPLPSDGRGKGGVMAVPKSAGVMPVKDTQGQLPGRVAVAIEIECRGGTLEGRLERGGVL